MSEKINNYYEKVVASLKKPHILLWNSVALIVLPENRIIAEGYAHLSKPVNIVQIERTLSAEVARARQSRQTKDGK